MLEFHTSFLPPALPCAQKEVRHASGVVRPLEWLLEERALSRHPPTLSGPPTGSLTPSPPPSTSPPPSLLLTIHAGRSGSGSSSNLALLASAARRLPGDGPPRLAAVLVQRHNLACPRCQLAWKRHRSTQQGEVEIWEPGLGKIKVIKQHVTINLAAPFC